MQLAQQKLVIFTKAAKNFTAYHNEDDFLLNIPTGDEL